MPKIMLVIGASYVRFSQSEMLFAVTLGMGILEPLYFSNFSEFLQIC